MKTLKNYLVITLMFLMVFVSNKCHAQDGLSLTVTQDIKLGLGMDKEHNDGEPTLDFMIILNMEGKQFEYYYFSVQSYFEHAELKSGYFRRYGVNTVWNLNSLVLPKLKLGFGIGGGVIHRRNSGGLLTYSGILEISYPISKKIDLMLRNELMRRPDLITPKLGYNLGFGANYKF